MEENKIASYAPVLIRLLRSPVYHDRDREIWNQLLQSRSSVEEYFEKIGVKLYLDETEGFAFITQPHDDDEQKALPRLTRAIPLSFGVSLLCVLLRERLYHYETNQKESAQIVVRREEMYEFLKPYFKEQYNEEKQRDKFDSIINKVRDLGFLRELKDHQENIYKIERIIKAKISADKLQEMKDMLINYEKSKFNEQ